MNTSYSMNVIAYLRGDLSAKFGIPRQSGLAPSLRSTILFEPEYRAPEALRGLEGFSHLWLIWVFSENIRSSWTPTVRPPRLGGNTRMGVFATRSPFRPNPIGLSIVKLEGLEQHPDYGTILHISGADLMDGTPLLDIKPYIPYTDAHPEAAGGFASAQPDKLDVLFPPQWLRCIPEAKQAALLEILSCDPRPSYQQDPERVYGMDYAGFNINFMVQGKTVTVTQVHPCTKTS